MSLKNGVLNFLVLSLALFFTLKNFEVWTKPIKWVPEKEVAKEVRNKPESPPILEKEDTPASLNSSTPIAERNIFSPKRKDFPTTAMGQTKKTMARPQIVLYGVTIVEDYQAASIVNPGRPLRKGERETFTIKLGEKIGEYKLAETLSDRITLEANGDNFDVLLYDPKMPKKRTDVKPEIKPATVTSTQPNPTSPTPGVTTPTPPPVSVKATKPSPRREAVAPPPPATRRPSFPPPESRRGRRPFYPPSGSPAQGTGGNQ